jgi:hypothetical protein
VRLCPGRHRIYEGGAGGTLLAEYQVSSFITDGTAPNPFTPTVLPAGVGSPGELNGATFDLPDGTLAAILHLDSVGGEVGAFLTSVQFPTSPGTFALDTNQSFVQPDSGEINATPDTLVVRTSAPAATPEPASLTLLGAGALGLLGYGWQKRRRAAA